MASPVILKPWAISPTEAIPLLVALNTKSIADHVNGSRLVLKQKQDLKPVEPPGHKAIERLAVFAAEQWQGQRYPL